MSSSVSPRRLEGKVALITGGASGIGECTVRLFVTHGAKVVVADIQDDLGCSVCESLGLESAIYVHCDVTNESNVENAVAMAISTYGKLDIMFNNAGIVGQNEPRIADNTKAEFERVLSVNVTGVFLGTKHAAGVMIPARSGSIINTASIASYVAGTTTHAYAASKHAVVGLTKNTAVELGQFGIRVNCVSPFGCATPLATRFFNLEAEQFEQEMNQLANLKGTTFKKIDVANAVLFLASDEGRYISGHNLLIDGGFSVVNLHWARLSILMLKIVTDLVLCLHFTNIFHLFVVHEVPDRCQNLAISSTEGMRSLISIMEIDVLKSCYAQVA